MAQELCEDKSRSILNMESSSTSGFCYDNQSTIQSHLVNQIQGGGYEHNQAEIFNLTTGMEMIGFSKSHDHLNSSSSKTADHFYHHHQQQQQQDDHDQFNNPTRTTHDQDQQDHNLMVSWQDQNSTSRLMLVDQDSSLRCVFPCEGNERPSQGLSLSLSSNNPSSIGLQSFELRHTNHNHAFFGKPMNYQQELQDGVMLKPSNLNPQDQFLLRNSKFLAPAQELLSEFCSLASKQSSEGVVKQKLMQKHKQWEDDINGGSSSNSSRKQALSSIEFMELQKKKTKLLSMLEELDRRYRHYCDQMKGVVASFEAVAGNGAAKVYSALASKAMSRHFRCLRDGIVGQIHATKKAMGEKDPIAPGTTKGETPRLKVIDQALRQQRALQQMHMMESHPWRPQRGLPERSVAILRAWLFEHFLHPYPSDVDKHILARQTGLNRSQVSNWFINARVRLWKPMVEEMYMEETKEQLDNMASSDGDTDNLEDAINGSRINRQNLIINSSADQKPTQNQLMRIDSECLSSIITAPDKLEHHQAKGSKVFNQGNLHHQNYGTFGAVELDFGGGGSSSRGGVNNGVSLTLGLQQHGGSSGAVSLAFSPAASQSSLFYPRGVVESIEDCQPVHQYSLLDGEAQNLPYRNLMGAQLLHDLAG